MINVPETDKKRIVIAGCGFAGLTLARKLKKSGFQVVIVDKHNYHQFPPLYYQVASAGLDASAILFPLRRIFQGYDDYFIRKAEVKSVDPEKNKLMTSAGELDYDFLIMAFGATNSYFGSKEMEEHAKGMKTIAEVLDLRNSLLMNFERAVVAPSEEERTRHMNIVIIGGGPSGVEFAGALAEMNTHVIPKDFPEFKNKKVNIYLVEASDRLLNVMSPKSSAKAREFLEKAGVHVMTHTKATGCDDKSVTTTAGVIETTLLIWTAGIKGNHIEGLVPECYSRNGRIIVDRFNKVKGCENIYALGDLALMTEEKYPNGHPQVAQVAIQQAELLASNLQKAKENKPQKEFFYKDLGTMATIGKNLAVVELPYIHFHGIFAWFVWMFIHLMSIVGVKNRLLVFFNWAWKYFTYNQSTRIILRPKGSS
jgi:NADH dehydrogenase